MLRVYNVLNVRTGKVLDAEELLKRMPEQEKHKLRAEQLGPKIRNYACPVCDQKVYLSGKGKAEGKIYHFRHFPNLGECPLKEGNNISKEDLKKIIYNGAKESERHMKLKTWMGDFLRSLKPKGEFTESKIETRITSAEGKKHWRQPDVSCVYKGKPLVFEFQLNNTFVEVIQGREEFYANEHTYICWLFDGFNSYDTAFGQRDIFWLNKSNAFAITEETMRLSEEKGDLLIECHYTDPVIDGTDVKNRWVTRILSFSEFNLNESYYKPFYFDSDSAREKLELKLLVEEFENYICGGRKEINYKEQRKKDGSFLSKLKIHLQNESIPNEITDSFINIIDALYFLKTGKVENLNHNFNNIKQFTNQIIQYYPQHGYIYCKAVKEYHPDFKSEQLGDKLKKKVNDFWKEFKIAEKEGKPNSQDKSYDSILKLLFPELEKYLAELAKEKTFVFVQ